MANEQVIDAVATTATEAHASSDGAFETLRFQSWNSAPDVTFWQKLATLKLDTFRLSDQAQELTGYFTPGRSANVPARFTVDDSSFDGVGGQSAVDRARYEWKAPGVLINTNTLEDFKNLDKAAVLQQAGERILRNVLANDDSSVDALNSFVLVTFADLKKHSFLYWFGFPALTPASPFQSRASQAVAAALSSNEQAVALRALLQLWDNAGDGGSSAAASTRSPFFVIERLYDTATSSNSNDDAASRVRVQSLQAWRSARTDADPAVQTTLFGFVDPCPLAAHPGWPLRNLLALLAALPSAKLRRDAPVQVLAFREHVHHLRPNDHDDAQAFGDWRHSRVFAVQLGESQVSPTDVRVVGWETNARGKLGPRLMDLAGILDPMRLAETSVDLNLKLMRWRQLPELDLAKLATTKCLLLGAGTLGCYTARSLLAWGFRHITFVDNARVSHSNPVRQPLFEFADVGKPKGASAARALERVYPLVKAKAEELTIPMAGHALSSAALEADAARALAALDALIDAHDVVFLGTDSRESRWLPTVIAASKRKLVLNAALGFDSYLVMRHGVRPEAVRLGDSTDDSASPTAAALGCYFCNDIVSPRDSLKDRTLDQMCTVTRPGLAPIAAATAVELLVAVLHAADGKYASAVQPTDTSAPLAYIPHQLRGFLNAFNAVTVTGEAFDKCIACSARVLDAYAADPFTLLQRACDSSSYLEDLTGLSALTQEVDALAFDLEIDDSDDDSELV